MSTRLRTPTRMVTLVLRDPTTGIDWSGDYVGNNRPAELRPDPDGVASYVTDDATASWWERQCVAQQEADDALASLTPGQRDAVTVELAAAGQLDLEDQPGAILAAIEAVRE